MRGRAGRTTGLKGVILFLLSGLEPDWTAAGGMVQRLIPEPVLAHVLVCGWDNVMCCAPLRFVILSWWGVIDMQGRR